MSKARMTWLAGVTVASAVLCAAVWRATHPAGARASGPIPHHAYVWQRAWTGEVRRAVTDADPNLVRLVALAAEVQFHASDPPRLVRAALDYAALLASGRGVGLALRVGPYPGPFRHDDAPATFLADLAESIITEARRAGLMPAELHVDFDCAESKLDGYRLWLEAIRPRAAPTPVTVTALPCWLDRPAFGRLIAAADGYVLQVHSVQPPRASPGEMVLCDPAAAAEAVERAARFGRPFRVALPTYAYLAAFDASGRLLGLSAEGPSANWPDDADLRAVRSDAGAMAGLVRAWTADRPAAMAGVIWYRLPVAGDRWNWRPPTLSAVMAGRTPRANLHAHTRRVEPGLVEIELANIGDADAVAGVSVAVGCDGADVLAADALGGFRCVASPRGGLLLCGPQASPAPLLGPGQRRMIGWVRLRSQKEVEAHVLPSGS
jgi:hypothetical protein